MSNLIKAPTAIVKTNNNECVIRLEIALNINVNGQQQKPEIKEEESKEKDDWYIPDFNSSTKLNFGKEAK
jgi:hypothetical protein